MFEHFVLFKIKVINRKKKSKLNLWVRLNQLPSSVVSTLVRESVRVIMALKYLTKKQQKQSKLALKLIKGHKLYRRFIFVLRFMLVFTKL